MEKLNRSFEYLTSVHQNINGPNGLSSYFEFLNFSKKLIEFILFEFPNDHYIESKIREMPKLEENLDALQTSTLTEILLLICRATIIFIPIHYYFRKKQREKTFEVIDKVNHSYDLISGIVFKIQNPNWVKHDY